MIYIKPISDLRNKYPEVEDLVLKKDEEIYLTKNGYGSMVIMSLDKYSKLMEKIGTDKALEVTLGNIENALIDEETNVL